MDREEILNSRRKDIEQLETIAFHFTQLSKRLSQDCEYWRDTGKDMAKAIEGLNKIIHQFSDFEQKLSKQVTAVLQREGQEIAGNIAKVCSETTKIVLAEQIKVTAEHLSKVAQQASYTLSSYQREVKSIRRWFLIGIILSALIGNVLAGVAVYHFLPLTTKKSPIQTLEERLEAIRVLEEKGKKSSLPSSIHQPSRVRNKISK